MKARLASAFKVDRLMRRTVLYVIHIWHVDEVALIKLFPVPDLCAALIVFFPRGGASKEKV